MLVQKYCKRAASVHGRCENNEKRNNKNCNENICSTIHFDSGRRILVFGQMLLTTGACFHSVFSLHFRKWPHESSYRWVMKMLSKIVQSASTNGTLKAALETDEKIGYKHSHATFVSKLTFFWLTPLLWRGYKDPLEIDDLGNSHESETCRAQYDRFQYIYRRQAVSNKFFRQYLVMLLCTHTDPKSEYPSSSVEM